MRVLHILAKDSLCHSPQRQLHETLGNIAHPRATPADCGSFGADDDDVCNARQHENTIMPLFAKVRMAKRSVLLVLLRFLLRPAPRNRKW